MTMENKKEVRPDCLIGILFEFSQALSDELQNITQKSHDEI